MEIKILSSLMIHIFNLSLCTLNETFSLKYLRKLDGKRRYFQYLVRSQLIGNIFSQRMILDRKLKLGTKGQFINTNVEFNLLKKRFNF